MVCLSDLINVRSLYRVFDYIPSLASQAVQSVLLKQAGVGCYRSEKLDAPETTILITRSALKVKLIISQLIQATNLVLGLLLPPGLKVVKDVVGDGSLQAAMYVVPWFSGP